MSPAGERERVQLFHSCLPNQVEPEPGLAVARLMVVTGP